MHLGKVFFPGFLVIALSLILIPVSAQVASETPAVAFPFIRQDLNGFIYQEQGLDRFYAQLQRLELKQRRTVNIVHIGDSHLQADFFSGAFRQMMHKRFGAAGRGLVFPFKLAHTNSPADIKSFSNTDWEVKRNVSPSKSLPIGISGITLRTSDPNFSLQLSLGSNGGNLDYHFNKVTIFNEKGPACYSFLLSEADDYPKPEKSSEYNEKYHIVESGESVALLSRRYHVSIDQLRKWNHLKNDLIYPKQKVIVYRSSAVKEMEQPIEYTELARIDNSYQNENSYSTTVFLDHLVKSVYLRGEKTAETQSRATLYGIVLENDTQQGILYHMIGVNGAMFRHYNATPNFFPQVRELHPDLIIVSLGTNESSGETFNEKWFYDHVNRMISTLRLQVPYADILLMTPSDAYRGRKFENPNAGKAKDVLLRYGQEHKLSVWNFYEVMGGFGAIDEWYRNGLAQRDRLHLTRMGYKLQGQLLYGALMNGYEDFLSNGTR